MDILIIFVLIIALIRESLDNKSGKKQYRPPSSASSGRDQDHLDALFVLMAGEDGVFVPGAESRFDALDDSAYQNDYRDADDGDDYAGYDGAYDEERDEGEYSDHWGPV